MSAAASTDWMGAGYRLIAELLLHPCERDEARTWSLVGELDGAPAAVTDEVTRFLEDSRGTAADEYVQTLELSPACPLYLGSYLFDEPTTCRGIGTSGRNRYMLELIAAYGHFGLELAGHELPDHLPTVAEFLALSRERADRDRIGLRRSLLERHVRLALAPLRARLHQYQSPYERLVAALEALVAEDVAAYGDTPAWAPPAPPAPAPAPDRVRLPVVRDDGASDADHPHRDRAQGATRACSQEGTP